MNDGKPESATVRMLTADATFLLEQRFCPDQRWISFIAVNASDAGMSTVYVMPAGGGSWKPITDGTTYDDKPHWAPDGRTIYFVSHRDGVLNVWGRRIDPATGWPSGDPFRVTSFNNPRQMISTHLSQMQIAVTAGRLFLPITETQSELWVLENVDLRRATCDVPRATGDVRFWDLGVGSALELGTWSLGFDTCYQRPEQSTLPGPDPPGGRRCRLPS